MKAKAGTPSLSRATLRSLSCATPKPQAAGLRLLRYAAAAALLAAAR